MTLSRRAALKAAGLAALAAGCTTSHPPKAIPSTSPSTLPRAGLGALATRLTGPLLLPGSAAYAAAVRLYNPRFDGATHPVAIARCASAADVAACVRWATSTGTPLHLRAGGHSYGGWSSGAGLVVDVRDISAVVSGGGHARVGAGARLVQVYSRLAASGHALAAGSCPTVGVTGLALGGGVGVLTRAYGLTCDSLTAVELVTADGLLRRVSATADPDLFWALCGGGGGSFGAVTALTFALRPAPTVVTFFRSWDLSHGEEVLNAWQHWIPGTDKRLWSTCKLLVSPGRDRALVAGTWIGPASSLDGQLAPLLSRLPRPASASTRSRRYADAMLFEAGCSGLSATTCEQHALARPSRQPFAATSVILGDPLSAQGIAATAAGVRAGREVPGMVEGGLSFDALGGAVASVGVADTAFPHRQALATVQATATWSHGAPGPYDDYVHGLRARLVPFTGSSAYVNYADPTIGDYASAYWGSNVPRLRSVKRTYDEHELFTFAQAVRP